MEKPETIDILLTIPEKLNEKIQAQARDEKRSRHSQIVFILEKNCSKIGRNVSILNPETFLAANPFIAFEPIEEILVGEFFIRLENRDVAWTNLRNYLEANLISLKVFKVGTVRREVYAVGLFQGHIVGIRTFAVET